MIELLLGVVGSQQPATIVLHVQFGDAAVQIAVNPHRLAVAVENDEFVKRQRGLFGLPQFAPLDVERQAFADRQRLFGRRSVAIGADRQLEAVDDAPAQHRAVDEPAAADQIRLLGLIAERRHALAEEVVVAGAGRAFVATVTGRGPHPRGCRWFGLDVHRSSRSFALSAQCRNSGQSGREAFRAGGRQAAPAQSTRRRRAVRPGRPRASNPS